MDAVGDDRYLPVVVNGSRVNVWVQGGLSFEKAVELSGFNRLCGPLRVSFKSARGTRALRPGERVEPGDLEAFAVVVVKYPWQ